MTDSAFPFSIFANHELPREPHKSSLLAVIPANIESKETLLETLATQLHFPAHFGKNWDALEEILRDFSWLAKSQNPITSVEIVHHDLPLAHSEKEQHIYLQILANALQYWHGETLLKLTITFPASEKSRITSQLAKS